MDYGKFRYQQEKRKRSKKKKKVIVIKEIKLSVKIAENDISYKSKTCKRILRRRKPC